MNMVFLHFLCLRFLPNSVCQNVSVLSVCCDLYYRVYLISYDSPCCINIPLCMTFFTGPSFRTFDEQLMYIVICLLNL